MNRPIDMNVKASVAAELTNEELVGQLLAAIDGYNVYLELKDARIAELEAENWISMSSLTKRLAKECFGYRAEFFEKIIQEERAIDDAG